DIMIRGLTGVIVAAMLVVPLLVVGDAAADEKAPDSPPQKSPADQQEPLSEEAQRVADELKTHLPAESEARAMLDHILAGSRLGPGEGWFGRAKAQTRFDFDAVREACDADADGQVDAQEFGGSQDDFARVDRNADEVLTPEDFDWSEHSLSSTPGFMLFFQADRDTNGKITREEFARLFDSLNSTSQEFLSLDELREQFQPPTEEQTQRQRAQRADRPSRSTLVLALQQQEIGSLQPGPALDELAPDFTLSDLDGREVTLSEEIGEQ